MRSVNLTKGAWLAGRRLMAIDGVRLDAPGHRGHRETVPDDHLGTEIRALPPGADRRPARMRLPRVRRRRARAVHDAETTLARGLPPAFEDDMLVMADAGYFRLRPVETGRRDRR